MINNIGNFAPATDFTAQGSNDALMMSPVKMALPNLVKNQLQLYPKRGKKVKVRALPIGQPFG